MTTVCPEWQWGTVGEVRRWGRTLCLDCFMQKCISNWFSHVQVAPAVLTVELEMAYPNGCSYVLELITPAQRGLTASISPGPWAAGPCGTSVPCHTGSPHWHCCLQWCGTAVITKLHVKPITGGIRHPTRANSLQLREGPSSSLFLLYPRHSLS